MIESLITSKTRIKLLLKFFLNSQTKSYLRNLEAEFGESTNAIRVELNRFEEAGLLQTEVSGKKKFYKANTLHPLFADINSILRKIVGIDKLIESVVTQVGDLEKAYITGDFARGIDSQIIDLVLVGKNLNTSFIEGLVTKAGALITRKIRYLILTSEQMNDFFKNKPVLLIWESDK